MSFNKEESPRKSKTPLKLDPQLLFQQFKPDLYFNSPKISNHSQWFIVAEQVVPASREMFWSTIVIKCSLRKSTSLLTILSFHKEAMDLRAAICHPPY